MRAAGLRLSEWAEREGGREGEPGVEGTWRDAEDRKEREAMPGKGTSAVIAESSALVVAPKVQSDPVPEEEDVEVPITL